MPVEAAAKTLAEQMVRAARFPHPELTKSTGKPDARFSGRARLITACGLALLVLLLLLWRKATDEPFLGSWAQSAAAAGSTEAQTDPARPRVALAFSRGGSFEGSVEGKDLSGRWKVVGRDGQTNTVELTTPGEPPQVVQATPLDDGRLRVSFVGGQGTYNLSPSNNGCS
jgi:hypothetical protein